jgi:hypothetical protein
MAAGDTTVDHPQMPAIENDGGLCGEIVGPTGFEPSGPRPAMLQLPHCLLRISESFCARRSDDTDARKDAGHAHAVGGTEPRCPAWR